MDSQLVHHYLDHPADALPWLRQLGLGDPAGAHANFVRMAMRGVTLDLLANICQQFAHELPRLGDPDMALNNLQRFVETSRNPLSLGALFERDPDALPTLLQIFSSSQYLSDLLVRDMHAYDLLRMTEGTPVRREELIREILSEVEALADERMVMTSIRRYKQREMLRIAYGDIVRGQKLETVTAQLSYLADAIVEAALRAARRKLAAKRPAPQDSSGQPVRFVVLALGKLGGVELNYSSDIDLVLLYDSDPSLDGARAQSHQDFFERLTREMVRLLTESTDQLCAYRVDLRLRPHGSQGKIVGTREDYLHYYDVYGRTWERQAYVKARPIAGDLDLGWEFLEQLQPWIYRRYLSLTDITGIKSLKRKIEQQAAAATSERNVKTGHGGIRDIEFAIQFLQLLNGATLPQIRTGNTLEAIALLEQAGCLTMQERTILEENYRFLRKVEHRLQIMFDLQTHTLPASRDELRKLAIRLGYTAVGADSPLVKFERDLEAKTALNHKILDHLLHDAFRDDAQTEPEVDLVNDPDPSPERIASILGRYPFRDLDAAYQNLMTLATEKIRFLSTRRCRHFLASIAPRLLSEIATTPDPDATLVNLSQVSDSLGGKGVLWELFSFNRPSLTLYVRLCSACPYLSGILTSNPGMLDELMDSLLVGRLPDLELLEQSLAELCRGAEDCDPILHSFKDAQHLRVGVRDILGRDDIQATHAALADVAEACLHRIAEAEYEKLIAKYGQPTIAEGPRAGEPCSPVILALGKLGGREPNYHSDIDVVFLYEADGNTVARRGQAQDTTTNQYFFSQLAQRIIKITNQLGPYGRLYEVDPRLRPTGRSGALAVPLDELRRYFASGSGQLWERQALCKARTVFGSDSAQVLAMEAVAEAAFGQCWRPSDAQEIRQMRARLEETAGPGNLKRGRGGTVDIEFLVQMLQLQHGRRRPEIRVPGTLAALDALHTAGLLETDDYKYFSRSYRFLRSVEARIRLMDSASRHELPSDRQELRKLAYLLQYDDIGLLVSEAERYRGENRRRFDGLFDLAEQQSAELPA